MARRRARLEAIRSDRKTHEATLGEMQAAEKALEGAVTGLQPTPEPETARVPFERYRGLLEWPADGRVSAGFGHASNARPGTGVARSGLDIDAPFGSAVRAIQDGTVVFAQWFRGYGLTVILDHGGGWLSVYAHGSALLVEKGDTVRRHQKIAAVGDSGSLRGPYLYFEIRKDGKAVDPMGWLHPR